MRVLNYKIRPDWSGIKTVSAIVLLLLAITAVGFGAAEITGKEQVTMTTEINDEGEPVDGAAIPIDHPVGYFFFGILTILFSALVLMVVSLAVMFCLLLIRTVAVIEKVDGDTQSNQQ